MDPVLQLALDTFEYYTFFLFFAVAVLSTLSTLIALPVLIPMFSSRAADPPSNNGQARRQTQPRHTTKTATAPLTRPAKQT